MAGSTMGQVRHGSATTTQAVRAALQRSQAALAQLSRELGINPKTVAKWRKRATVEDLKTGPKEPRSTVLTGPGSGRQLLSRFGVTGCCRWTTASTPFNPRSRA
jgi:transposase-like protein